MRVMKGSFCLWFLLSPRPFPQQSEKMALSRALQDEIERFNRDCHEITESYVESKRFIQGALAKKAIVESQGVRKYYSLSPSSLGLVDRFEAILLKLPLSEEGGTTLYSVGEDGIRMTEQELCSPGGVLRAVHYDTLDMHRTINRQAPHLVPDVVHGCLGVDEAYLRAVRRRRDPYKPRRTSVDL